MAIGSFTGLGTGIDWSSVIDQMITYDAQPRARLQNQMKAAETGKKAWEQVQKMVKDFRSLNSNLRFGRAFESMAVEVGTTSAGVAAFTATADGTAPAGTYQVQVLSIARTETMASGSFTDATKDLELSGSFTLNGVSITVEAGNSLNDIRDTINAAGAGVRATVLKVSATEYQLSIKADAAGFAGVKLVDGDDAVGVALGLTTTVPGSDAQVVVDGTTFTRSSNVLTDVVPGVTLRLNAAMGTESVDMVVSSDNASVADEMNSWVEKFNAIISFLDSQQEVVEGRTPGALHSAGALTRYGESMLKGALGDNLFEYGIERGRDGKLTFDRKAFLKAWDANPADVRTRLQDTLAASMESAIVAFGTDADSVIVSAMDSADRAIKSYQNQIDRWNHRLEVRREGLMKQFNAVEKMISQMNGQMSGIAGSLMNLANSSK